MARLLGRFGDPALAQLEDDVRARHCIEHLLGLGVGRHVAAHAKGDLELDARRLPADHLPRAAAGDTARLEDRGKNDGTLWHGHHLPADDGRGKCGDHQVLNGKTLLEIGWCIGTGKGDAGTLPARSDDAFGDAGKAIFGHCARGSSARAKRMD